MRGASSSRHAALRARAADGRLAVLETPEYKLHRAVSDGKVEEVRRLLEEDKVDPNTTNPMSNAPYLFSAIQKHLPSRKKTQQAIEIIDLLVAHGAKVDATTAEFRMTALMMAATPLVQSADIAECLLRHGADPRLDTTLASTNLLIPVLPWADARLVQAFLKAGARPNQNHPLLAAAPIEGQHARLYVTALLLAYGADPLLMRSDAYWPGLAATGVTELTPYGTLLRASIIPWQRREQSSNHRHPFLNVIQAAVGEREVGIGVLFRDKHDLNFFLPTLRRPAYDRGHDDEQGETYTPHLNETHLHTHLMQAVLLTLEILFEFSQQGQPDNLSEYLLERSQVQTRVYDDLQFSSAPLLGDTAESCAQTFTRICNALDPEFVIAFHEDMARETQYRALHKLFNAIKQGESADVTYYLERDVADIHADNVADKMLLQEAMTLKDEQLPDMVELLISRGFDVNGAPQHNPTNTALAALCKAVRAEPTEAQVQVFERLLEAGADTSLTPDLLHIVSSNGNAFFAARLLKMRLDPNARDSENKTPLFRINIFNKQGLRLCAKLLAHGATASDMLDLDKLSDYWKHASTSVKLLMRAFMTTEKLEAMRPSLSQHFSRPKADELTGGLQVLFKNSELPREVLEIRMRDSDESSRLKTPSLKQLRFMAIFLVLELSVNQADLEKVDDALRAGTIDFIHGVETRVYHRAGWNITTDLFGTTPEACLAFYNAVRISLREELVEAYAKEQNNVKGVAHKRYERIPTFIDNSLKAPREHKTAERKETPRAEAQNPAQMRAAAKAREPQRRVNEQARLLTERRARERAEKLRRQQLKEAREAKIRQAEQARVERIDTAHRTLFTTITRSIQTACAAYDAECAKRKRGISFSHGDDGQTAKDTLLKSTETLDRQMTTTPSLEGLVTQLQAALYETLGRDGAGTSKVSLVIFLIKAIDKALTLGLDWQKTYKPHPSFRRGRFNVHPRSVIKAFVEKLDAYVVRVKAEAAAGVDPAAPDADSQEDVRPSGESDGESELSM